MKPAAKNTSNNPVYPTSSSTTMKNAPTNNVRNSRSILAHEIDSGDHEQVLSSNMMEISDEQVLSSNVMEISEDTDNDDDTLIVNLAKSRLPPSDIRAILSHSMKSQNGNIKDKKKKTNSSDDHYFANLHILEEPTLSWDFSLL